MKGISLPNSQVGQTLHFVVPGKLATRTGGYHYDRRIIAALRASGWCVHLHELDGSFPAPSARAMQGARQFFASLPDGDRVVVDGLAYACLPALMTDHASRLTLLALVHHPLASETGLPPNRRLALFESERRALAVAAGIIVTSEFTAGELADYAVGQIQVTVVRPGVDLMAQSAGSNSTTPNLLCVGAVTPRKGHKHLIEALTPLTEYPWKLVCVGSLDRDGDCAASVLDQIARAGLGARVEMRGELADEMLLSLYQQTDLFVMASAYEGYGMVYDEAVACGLPVVSTRVGAVEQIVPLEARRLVEPGDVDALSAVLQSVLEDSAGLQAMRNAARSSRHGSRSWTEAGDEFAAAIL